MSELKLISTFLKSDREHSGKTPIMDLKSAKLALFKSHSPWDEGLLDLDFLSFSHNLKPCDWSDCSKGFLSLVENGSNLSE